MKSRKNLIIIVFVVLISLLGLSYAFFNYYQISQRNLQLITGEIYLRLDDGTEQINLTNSFPESATVARSRDDNFITFSITGKNTTTNKDIYYEIMLTEGDEIAGRTRLNPNDVRFDLIEIIDGVETYVVSDESFSNFNSVRLWVNTVNANTTTEVEVTYKLRMWISEDVLISDTDNRANYTTGEYMNSYASVKISVFGDFTEKVVPTLYSVASKNLASSLSGMNGDTEWSQNFVVGDDVDNYVWYSGKLWRIISFNNNGTIKMITEDCITSITYNEDGNVNFEGSYMYQWLNEDFLDTLYNYDDVIELSSSWDFFGEGITAYSVTAPVGLISIIDYLQAGSYLNTGYRFLTSTATYDSMMFVEQDGSYGDSSPTSSYFNGVRPVINLKANVKLLDGTGSYEDPYILKNDISSPRDNVSSLNERVSGEYVKFDGELYRIVGVENNLTKITSVNYLTDSANNVITKSLASSNLFGKATNTQSDNYWDYYLNNTWISGLSDSYRKMIVDNTWYLGLTNDTLSYKSTICASPSGDIPIYDRTNVLGVSVSGCERITDSSKLYYGKIGLGRNGEMFASQFDNEAGSDFSLWTLTPGINNNALYIFPSGVGFATGGDLTELNAVRPSFYLSKDVKISSGVGTLSSPFEITL